MFFFDTEELLSFRENFRLSNHALREAHKEGLRALDIFYAIFHGEILEQYPERQRVLVSGPSRAPKMPVHVVCEYVDSDALVVVTVYIPNRPYWMTAGVRG